MYVRRRLQRAPPTSYEHTAFMTSGTGLASMLHDPWAIRHRRTATASHTPLPTSALPPRRNMGQTNHGKEGARQPDAEPAHNVISLPHRPLGPGMCMTVTLPSASASSHGREATSPSEACLDCPYAQSKPVLVVVLMPVSRCQGAHVRAGHAVAPTRSRRRQVQDMTSIDLDLARILHWQLAVRSSKFETASGGARWYGPWRWWMVGGGWWVVSD